MGERPEREQGETGERARRVRRGDFTQRSLRAETNAASTQAKSARRWAALRAAWNERRAVHKCHRNSYGTCETACRSIHVPAHRPATHRRTATLLSVDSA